MLAIIHNASHWVPLGVTRYMVILFLFFFLRSFHSPFQRFRPGVYWSDDVFCTWEWCLTLTWLQMFFLPLPLYVMWSVFTWVLTRLCQRVSVFLWWSFKSVHVTLHLAWVAQKDSSASIVDGQINACRSRNKGFHLQILLASLRPFPLHCVFLFPLSSNCWFTTKIVNQVKAFARVTTLFDRFPVLHLVYAQSFKDI